MGSREMVNDRKWLNGYIILGVLNALLTSHPHPYLICLNIEKMLSFSILRLL